MDDERSILMPRHALEGAGSSAAEQAIDEYVCWSRMQAEAGQALELILARKELERRAGDGLFVWGVGNAPAVITNVLSRLGKPIKVIFSIMKSKPKAVDLAPASTVVWRRYLDTEGVERPLPENVVVTSRGESSSGDKRSHYALMCHSDLPLKLERGGRIFDPFAFRNASGTGGPVGASQVTALLRRVAPDAERSDYEENLTAELTGSYWVRLTDPVELSASKRMMLDHASSMSVDGWLDLSAALRRGRVGSDPRVSAGTLL